jgi:hypothetical protein
MKKIIVSWLLLLSIFFLLPSFVCAQNDSPIFDDKKLLEGYTQQYAEEPKYVLVSMIRDDNLSPFVTAAAIRVFNTKFSEVVFSREKLLIEKALLRRLALTNSVYVEIEIRHTLCKMDRYRYFESMVPYLLQRLDHYNKIVNELAYSYIDDIIKAGQNRSREARIVFNTLRKMLFLSKKKLKSTAQGDERLTQKIELLRWSIKILGNQELQRLPPEVIQLF